MDTSNHHNGSAWADADGAFGATTDTPPPGGEPWRDPTPEALARRAYQAGIDSCVRTIAKAMPGKKLFVFRQQAREAFRLAARGGFDLADVGDRLYGAGADLAELDVELGEGWQDTLTAVLGEAKAAALADLAAADEAAADSTGSAAQGAAPGTAPDERTLIVRRASEVAPERIEWLWPGRIAVGKLTLIGGTPGLGKSQLTAFLANVVTNGGAWPCDGGDAPRGSVILLSAEDGLADTIIPRLTTAGADLARVHAVTGVRDKTGRRGFDLKSDIARLEALARGLGDVRLIVIDPISAYLGTLDGNDVVRTRNVLEPVAEMADRLRIAVVAVTHLNKGGGNGQSVLNRFIGTIAFVAAARAAFAVIADANDATRRLFLPVKNNLAAEPKGLAFRIEQALLPGTDILASRVSFDAEPVDITANEALAAAEGVGGEDGRSGKDEAAEFLRTVLADGPVAVKELERQAVEAGLLSEGKPISQSKMFRLARDSLGIKPARSGGLGAAGQWVWGLPDA